MKLAVNAYVHNIDKSQLNAGLAIIDMRLSYAEILLRLRGDAEENGPFRLACYDTFQAGFAGAQFNDNSDVLRHAQALRELTTLPGKPATLVAAHPVKNANRDNLETYGGGSVMNGLDGNLTLWAEGGQIELGLNKVRVPEFDPKFFRVEKLGSPDILDNKGRAPLLPVIRPMSPADVESGRKHEAKAERKLLRAMIDDPDGTQDKWGTAIGRSKGRVNAKLQKLKQHKLVEEGRGKWRVTPKGMKESRTANGQVPLPERLSVSFAPEQNAERQSLIHQKSFAFRAEQEAEQTP
ncbi:MAG: hypothetical protein ACREO5_13800, partial [Candidatus Binatia bacterium]